MPELRHLVIGGGWGWGGQDECLASHQFTSGEDLCLSLGNLALRLLFFYCDMLFVLSSSGGDGLAGLQNSTLTVNCIQ